MSSEDDEEVSVVAAALAYAGANIDNFDVGLPILDGDGHALALYQSVTGRGRSEILLSFQDDIGVSLETTDVAEATAHYTDQCPRLHTSARIDECISRCEF
jgi:hypothetical protein